MSRRDLQKEGIRRGEPPRDPREIRLRLFRLAGEAGRDERTRAGDEGVLPHGHEDRSRHVGQSHDDVGASPRTREREGAIAHQDRLDSPCTERRGEDAGLAARTQAAPDRGQEPGVWDGPRRHGNGDLVPPTAVQAALNPVPPSSIFSTRVTR
ncbi:hypothetical protein ACFSTC_24080 [Nonomuraea ferruginea]